MVGFVFVVGGALVLRRSAATGALLAATGLAWFLGGFASWLVFLHRGPLVHLLLSFPRGRLESRFERAVVAGAYVEAVVYPLGRSSVATLVLLAAVLVASLLRHARAGGEERRARAAALLASAAIVAVLAAAAVARLSGAVADATWLWAYEIVLALAGVGLSADLLGGRWTQAAATGVVVELGDLDREGALRQRLARSVGDPSLELYYWDQARARYVDAAGEPIDLAGQSSDRVVLLVGDDTRKPAAAIVHDSAVLDEPLLVEAVTAAVLIAVANADLQAQVQANVEDVRASRRRLVEAADAERRRLERDLREASGPRLRLVAALLEQSEVEGAELRRELDGIREVLQRVGAGHPSACADGVRAGRRVGRARRTVSVRDRGRRRRRAAAAGGGHGRLLRLLRGSRQRRQACVRVAGTAPDAAPRHEPGRRGRGRRRRRRRTRGGLRPARARRPGRGARWPLCVWRARRVPAPGCAQRSLSPPEPLADETIAAGAVG